METKYRPFDLEETKARTAAGEKYPLITRNGLPARLVCDDVNNKEFPLVCLIKDKVGSEKVETYTKFGCVFSNRTTCIDLFMAARNEKGE